MDFTAPTSRRDDTAVGVRQLVQRLFYHQPNQPVTVELEVAAVCALVAQDRLEFCEKSRESDVAIFTMCLQLLPLI